MYVNVGYLICHQTLSFLMKSVATTLSMATVVPTLHGGFKYMKHKKCSCTGKLCMYMDGVAGRKVARYRKDQTARRDWSSPGLCMGKASSLEGAS